LHGNILVMEIQVRTILVKRISTGVISPDSRAQCHISWRPCPFAISADSRAPVPYLLTVVPQFHISRQTCPRAISPDSRAPHIHCFSICGSPRLEKKLENYRNKRFVNFQNARQAITGHNMVKSSSPNEPSTWLIFLCHRTHASPRNVPPFCF
jgi:hypothetical protein